MKGNFKKSLTLIRIVEGGNDDDKDDPGGRTSRGIIQREWDAYRTLHPEKNLPQDVWEAPDWAINDIYWLSYWLPWSETDWFKTGVDYSYADMKVHHGGYWATRILQRALGVKDDGCIGIVTKTALLKADSETLIKAIHTRRAAYMAKLYWFKKFGKGWISRNDFVERRALKMLEPQEPVSA